MKSVVFEIYIMEWPSYLGLSGIKGDTCHFIKSTFQPKWNQWKNDFFKNYFVSLLDQRTTRAVQLTTRAAPVAIQVNPIV